MHVLSLLILEALILRVRCDGSLATQEPKISLKSSSNFKAIEGYGFDMTCQVNDSEKHSIEFYLPNGKQAENYEYATVGPPSWNNNAKELKIIKAEKSRDEGLYKCIVDGTRTVEMHVEFVTEPFLNLSTPNPVVIVNRDREFSGVFVVDFVALPFPKFYITLDSFDPKNFFRHPLIEVTINTDQVDSNQLRITDQSKQRPTFYAGNATIIAKNTKYIETVVFKFTVEGIPFVSLAFNDESDYARKDKSIWDPITDLTLFYQLEKDKPNYFEWSNNTNKEFMWELEINSIPVSPLIAWIFQPCSNITTCTSFNELNKDFSIIGGIRTSNRFPAIKGFMFTPSTPGYLYVLAKNDLGIGKLKTGLNLKGSVRLLVVTENSWNSHLKRYEIAIGDDLSLRCETTSVYELVWWFNNNGAPNGSKLFVGELYTSEHMKTQQLFIQNVTKAHEGRYSCFDKNFKKETYDNVDLQIRVIEKIPLRIQSNFYEQPNNLLIQKVGDIIQLECSVENESIRNFSWYKDDQLLSETNKNLAIELGLYKISIKIKSATLQDSGNYSCVVMNNFSQDEHFVVLTFQNEKHFIIAGVAIVLISAIIILVLYIRAHWAKKEILELKAAGLANFEEGNLESFNKLLGLNEQADLLPYDPRFEFPIERLTLQEQLGSGAFGVVYKAIAKLIKPMESETIVAVKTINKLAPNEMLKALVVELKIMVHMGQHLNIVNLLGAITKNIAKRDLMVISEYCCYGDLEGFLRKYRSFFKVFERANTLTASRAQLRYVNLQTDSIGDTTSTDSVSSFNTDNLISWSFQVACGMDYLASKKVLHGDLAARNVLLCADYIVKISDFGLAKSLYQNYVYQRKDDALLPYKWLALESLIDNTFSVYSDIWAYGVLIWEIFTLGQTPYPEIIGIESLLNKLQSGYRLTKPEFSSQSIYKILLDCWKVEKKRRPSFAELEQRFGDMMQEVVRNNLIDRNEPFIRANQESIKNGRIDFEALLSQESEHDQGNMEGNDQTLYETMAMRNYSKPNLFQT